MMHPGLLLIRVGAGLTGVALVFSFWASPERMRSLPPFIIAMVGVALVVGVTGRRLPALARRLRLSHVVWFFLCAAFVALGTALLTSRWPTYKLSWLNSVYAALPSIRSLPFSWATDGLQPNQNGGILALCTAFAVAIALTALPTADRRFRGPAVFLAIAGFIVVFMTGSRAALAALTAAALLVLVARTLRWIWAWLTAAVVLALGLFASGQFMTGVRFFVRDESLSTKLVARLDIWSSALHGIQDHFLTGIGLCVFNEVMPARYPYRTVGLSYPVSQAHNLFLDVTLAIGFPGILGLVILLLGCVVLAISGMKRDPLTRAISTGLLASILAFLVFGTTDSISLSTPTSFIIWLWACTLALVHQGRPEANQQGTAPATRGRVQSG